jgi:protein transport protein SEC24
MAVQLRMESDLQGDRPVAAVQCALLYTATDGTRRIRVHTYSTTVCNNINTLFRSADLDALINFLAKRAIFDTGARTLEAARQDLIAQCVQILYVYRRFCASNPAPGQLILPETLKLLPLYTLGLLKNKVRLL